MNCRGATSACITTPAAVIERGTTGRQRTIVGTVANLAAEARAADVRSPAVVVVGSTVTLRDQIAWFESRPLLGRRILVTRARSQAGQLAELLEEQGAEVVVFPTIAIAPTPSTGYPVVIRRQSPATPPLYERQSPPLADPA